VAVEHDRPLLAEYAWQERVDTPGARSLDDQFRQASTGPSAHRLDKVFGGRVDDVGPEPLRQPSLATVGLADEQQPVEAEHAPQVLHEQKTGGTGADEERRTHPPFVSVGVQPVPRPGRASDRVHRVDDARQRLGERSLRRLQVGLDAHGVGSRDAEVLTHPAGQPRDSVFGIGLALVRVSGRTVLAKGLAAAAHAVEPLVHGDAVTDAQVFHLGASRDHLPGDLVAEDLRPVGEGHGPAALVRVVVGLPIVDMQVCAAEPHGAHAQEHVARPGSGDGYVPHLQTPHIMEHARAHGSGVGVDSHVSAARWMRSPISRRPAGRPPAS
jgi:hypothetical protein